MKFETLLEKANQECAASLAAIGAQAFAIEQALQLSLGAAMRKFAADFADAISAKMPELWGTPEDR